MHGAELLFVFIPFILAIRFLVDRLDRDRIRKDVAARGGEVEDITWRPFGRGWFGEKSDRVYEVAWTDGMRHAHVAWCKTSLFSGVFWSEDSSMLRGGAGRDVAALEAENRRLREELERVKRAGR